jgi:ferredoxin
MDERPINRRRFFREGLRELLKPLANAVERMADAAKHFNDLDQPEPTPAPPYNPYTPEQTTEQYWLRPPGSMYEQQFRDQCSRCGDCVRICPAQCIKIDETYVNGQGAPYIDADQAACALCDGILCSTNCPTNALVPTLLENVYMGLAVWHPESCLRTSGADCQVCIEKCPIADKAIRLVGNSIEVLSPGCVGRGMCQQHCPTYPKAIAVTPKAAQGY